MLASSVNPTAPQTPAARRPSFQALANSAITTAISTTRGPSRILCLKLEDITGPRVSNRVSLPALMEGFLKFSPRVQYREIRSGSAQAEGAARALWVFIDIASTSHLFRGEEGLANEAANLARDLGFGVQFAVADTPAGAQAFATVRELGTPGYEHAFGTIVPPGEERDRLKDLSLPQLLHLEGLEAWSRPSQIEHIITFFLMLGFKNAGDLSRFTMSAFQERWSDTGVLFWKRINAQDRQVISPFIPSEPLENYVHLDFPISLVSLLLHQMEKSFDLLFARLQGRRLFARKMTVTLHCEYSKAQHKVEIEPNTPSRDQDLFVTLLENRLGALDLDNPIRDFEVHVTYETETTRQLDFFEPRDTDQDKVQTLLSLLLQSALKPGFYEIQPSILPEGAFRIVGTNTASVSKVRSRGASEGTTEVHSRCAAGRDRLSNEGSGPSRRSKAQKLLTMNLAEGELAISYTPEYGAAIANAPRPTRLLKTPRLLSTNEVSRLRILSHNPIERIEDRWWDPPRSDARDYYFALSNTGECLWIYQDQLSQKYFLHGYFD